MEAKRSGRWRGVSAVVLMHLRKTDPAPSWVASSQPNALVHSPSTFASSNDLAAARPNETLGLSVAKGFAVAQQSEKFRGLIIFDSLNFLS